jgi:hypothetical protein
LDFFNTSENMIVRLKVLHSITRIL